MYAVVVERFDLLVVQCDETLTAEVADASTATRLGMEYHVTCGRDDGFSYKTEIRWSFGDGRRVP